MKCDEKRRRCSSIAASNLLLPSELVPVWVLGSHPHFSDIRIRLGSVWDAQRRLEIRGDHGSHLRYRCQSAGALLLPSPWAAPCSVSSKKVRAATQSVGNEGSRGARLHDAGRKGENAKVRNAPLNSSHYFHAFIHTPKSSGSGASNATSSPDAGWVKPSLRACSNWRGASKPGCLPPYTVSPITG